MGSVYVGMCDTAVMFGIVETCVVRFYINLLDPGDPEKGPINFVGQKF